MDDSYYMTIDPMNDTTVEPDETAALTLSSGTGYTLGTTTAVVGTITNDDIAPTTTYTLTPSAFTINEGSTLTTSVATTILMIDIIYRLKFF